jgi:phenylacetic acid degradation operon negative regulatory protein
MTTRAVPTLSTRGLLVFAMGLALPERAYFASKRLVDVMSDQGYEMGATRVTLARLCTTGQVERIRSGRETAYRISAMQGETNSTVAERVRAFGVHTEWDGQWTIVSFSIPEGARGLRVALKSRLGYMGFGRLREGMWCATRNCDDELKELTQSLDLDRWIDIFVGWPSPLEDVDDVIARC